MRASLLLSLLLTACAIQGGASMGHVGGVSELHAPRVWAGHIAAHARVSSLVAGAEFEGVGSSNRWSGFTTGLHVGFAPCPDHAPFELVLLADAGIPIGWAASPMAYLGATAELPIALDGALPSTERNRNLMLIGPRTQIAPFIRARYYFDSADATLRLPSSISFGVALRVKYSTDLIDLGTH